ncbi:MAG: helix-turn-helix transcriptional regulator [Pseudomonadota bacterium]|nr:helix-turn-helix transcriptional regulator [Pseudomonadota bacterium]
MPALTPEPSSPAAERRVQRELDARQLRWIARARSMDAVLDLLPQPLLLLVPGRPVRVWHANAAARCHCAVAGPVRLREDLLLVVGRDDAAAFDQALRDAASRGPGHRQQFTLGLEDGGAHGMEVLVEAIDFGASPDLPVAQLVLVELRPRSVQLSPLEALCRDHGLTRGEAATAYRLLSAGSIEAIARDTGKSIHTIRTQIKAAMVKTDTHTQAALVALVGRRLSA